VGCGETRHWTSFWVIYTQFPVSQLGTNSGVGRKNMRKLLAIFTLALAFVA
jgi:hypothetical protein